MKTFILSRGCQRSNEWIEGAAPRHHVCLSVNIWASGAVKISQTQRTILLGWWWYYEDISTFSPFLMNIFWVLSCAMFNVMFWSQIIKLLNSSQLLVHTQQGDWDHSGNLNVTTILDKYLFIRVFQLRKWDCLNIYKDFQIAASAEYKAHLLKCILHWQLVEHKYPALFFS